MLIIVIVLLVAWRILATIGKRLSERAPGADSYSRFSPQARRRRKQASERAEGSVEQLVECTVCGVFVPTSRALTAGGEPAYCSEACRNRAGAEPPSGRS
jgi:hypothetical protein